MKSGYVNICIDCKSAAQRKQREQSVTIKLSEAARRRIGVDPMPEKRVRHQHEAMPPENNLWKRDVLTAADMGVVHQRAGSDLAARLPSRGPFAS
jgi:hypothetical protein